MSLYMVEDVYLRPGQTDTYLENMGTKAAHEPPFPWDLVGIFAQLRPCGRWPRSVNLWQMDWPSFAGRLQLQFGDEPEDAGEFTDWWTTSAAQRSGGWDRVLLAGPGSPGLAEMRRRPTGPCVVQFRADVRTGAAPEHLAWLAQTVPAVLDGCSWQPILWARTLHESQTYLYLAAPDWHGLAEATAALPCPPSAFEARTEACALRAWAKSSYLDRAAAG